LLFTHRSEPYNPMIANTFFRSGMIESWGRGIEKITNACQTAGQPEPVFGFKRKREFSVTFYSVGTGNDTIKDTINDTINFRLNDTHNSIIKLMKATPHITVKAISGVLGINERNVKSNIKSLKNAGIIERTGANKNGQWSVKV